MLITRQEKNGVPFYACDGFTGTAHGFSTRLGGVSPAPWDSLNLGANRGDAPERVDENFRRFCTAVGCNPGALVKNHQIHSDVLRSAGPEDALPSPGSPGTFEADGLVTDVPGVCLVIFSADCIPILLYDPQKRVIAAAHAGWRGTALGIAQKAVEKMRLDYGCRAEDILAAIGPGISPCCFETHADVPDALFAALGAEAEPFIRPLGPVITGENMGIETRSGPGFISSRTEKYSVDLKGVNARWLRLAGVLEEHIALCPVCTACNGHEFWSHRRLGASRGSMASMIQLI